MQFRISDTFTDSLSRLTADVDRQPNPIDCTASMPRAHWPATVYNTVTHETRPRTFA